MQRSDSPDKIGSISGIITFFIGIALLILTFYAGFILLLDPNKLLAFADLIPILEAPEGEIFAIFARVNVYIIPIILLFVLGYISSKITAHGIQLYRARLSVQFKKAFLGQEQRTRQGHSTGENLSQQTKDSAVPP